MKILLDECAKNLPYPLLWRGIKGEVKTKTQVFRDALKRIAEYLQ